MTDSLWGDITLDGLVEDDLAELTAEELADLFGDLPDPEPVSPLLGYCRPATRRPFNVAADRRIDVLPDLATYSPRLRAILAALNAQHRKVTAMPEPRTVTPPRRNENGGTTYTLQRYCNGCDNALGDVTEEEITAAIAGRELPDVRGECRTCTPAAR